MKINMHFVVALACLAMLPNPGTAASPEGKLILEDAFERDEAIPTAEDVGNGWTTNSRSRAKGEKQVDLDQGAMHITRAEVADHGVSVVHDLEFKDATLEMRFKIGKGDSLGINIADMKEKSVHAGHICLALIKPNKVEIADLKTGRMNLEMRTRRLNKQVNEDDAKLLKTKSKYFDHKIATDAWHQLKVQIAGDVMTVSINGEQVGQFASPGIGHETKSRLRLAVAKSAWVDDVKVWRQ